MASQEVVEAARRVLLEVAAGRAVPWSEVELLLDAVLGAELVRLARDVEEGGEHVVIRAVQLAGAERMATAARARIETQRRGPGRADGNVTALGTRLGLVALVDLRALHDGQPHKQQLGRLLFFLRVLDANRLVETDAQLFPPLLAERQHASVLRTLVLSPLSCTPTATRTSKPTGPWNPSARWRPSFGSPGADEHATASSSARRTSSAT